MKALLSVLVLFGAFGFYNAVSHLSPYGDNDPTGSVIIRVIDERGLVVHEDTVSFSEEDTLFSLLNDHYDLGWSSMNLGGNESRIILSINDVITDFRSAYIMILIDGHVYNRHGEKVVFEEQMSTVGIDLIPLIDGNIYTFTYHSLADEGTGVE